jgi:hypothetical protein
MSTRSKPAKDPVPNPEPRSVKRRDLLAEHSRLAASALGVAAAGIFFASFSTGLGTHLPADAFEWEFGLQLLRGAVAVAIVWALLFVLIRGWGGRWPSRISTSGVEFDDLGRATEELGEGARLALEVVRGLTEMREKEPS